MEKQSLKVLKLMDNNEAAAPWSVLSGVDIFDIYD
jgi:hypothetical protein